MAERAGEPPFPKPQSAESLLPLRQARVAAEAGTEQPAGCASHNNHLPGEVQYPKAICVYNENDYQAGSTGSEWAPFGTAQGLGKFTSPGDLLSGSREWYVGQVLGPV